MSETEDDDRDRTLTGIRAVPLELGKRTAFLVIVASAEATGQMYRLDQPTMVLGRAPDAAIRIEDPGISRYHARIHVKEASIELVDLGSKNGTFFKDERIERAEIVNGDKFQVGTGTILKVSFQDALDERLQKDLYDSATRDPLTGLFNRKYFTESLAKDFSYCQRHDVPLTLVMLDLDHFKSINDTHGHPGGDFVLSQVSEALNEAVRHEDVLARVGGEEFAVVLRECDEAQAVRFAERIRRQVERMRLVFNGQELRVTLSAGVASLRGKEFSTPEELVAAADRNLYRAKESGRNRIYTSDNADVPW